MVCNSNRSRKASSVEINQRDLALQSKKTLSHPVHHPSNSAGCLCFRINLAKRLRIHVCPRNDNDRLTFPPFFGLPFAVLQGPPRLSADLTLHHAGEPQQSKLGLLELYGALWVIKNCHRWRAVKHRQTRAQRSTGVGCALTLFEW